jgi:hypothetical protein
LKELAALMPVCAGASARLLDAARVKDEPLGSRVSVRGFLVLGQMECTLMACSTVDKETGERRRAPCCNGCSAFWRLAGLEEASATRASGATPVFLRRAGVIGVFEAGGLDCIMEAIAAGPRAEIIASGHLETARLGNYLGASAPGARSIDDATLCATGRWISPRATAAGPLPDCQ